MIWNPLIEAEISLNGLLKTHLLAHQLHTDTAVAVISVTQNTYYFSPWLVLQKQHCGNMAKLISF